MMQQQRWTPETGHNLAQSCTMTESSLPTQQETLGQIVEEILRAGQTVNRKAICSKLVARLDGATGTEMEKHYYGLLALALGRE